MMVSAVDMFDCPTPCFPLSRRRLQRRLRCSGRIGGEGVTSSGVAGNDGQSAGGKLEGGSAN